MSKKRCSDCGKIRPIEKFGKDRNRKDGRNVYCLDCISIRTRESYKRNTEKVKARNNAWRFANPAKKKLARDRWNANNKERIKEKGREWVKKNPEKARLHTQNYQSRRWGNGGKLTEKEWLECLEESGCRCLKCGSPNNLSLDHIVPVLLGGRTEKSNTQVLCVPCNSSKGAKFIDYRKRK